MRESINLATLSTAKVRRLLGQRTDRSLKCRAYAELLRRQGRLHDEFTRRELTVLELCAHGEATRVAYELREVQRGWQRYTLEALTHAVRVARRGGRLAFMVYGKVVPA
ncbi:MAG TPA: hypothetical protein VKQ30_08405 [Ktedonobacterales bacterium]|nr:hypothetical protein [Ktedonobacterales bacterium]